MTESGTGRTHDAMATGDDPQRVVTRSEERMRVTAETVPVTRVRVRRRLVTEEETFTVPVTREEITVDYEDIPERDRTPVETSPLAPAEMELIRYEERVVITKQIVAVERVRFTRRVVTADHTVSGRVRHERIEIDDAGHAPLTSPADPPNRGDTEVPPSR